MLDDFLAPILGPTVPALGSPAALLDSAKKLHGASVESDGLARRADAVAAGVAGGGWFGVAALLFRRRVQEIADFARTSSAALARASGAATFHGLELQDLERELRGLQQEEQALDSERRKLETERSGLLLEPNAAAAIVRHADITRRLAATYLESMSTRRRIAQVGSRIAEAHSRASTRYYEVAAMAPSLRAALQAAADAAAKREQEAAKESKPEPGGLKGFFVDVAQVADGVWDTGWEVGRGAVNETKQLSLFVYHLSPQFNPTGFHKEWAALAEGIGYGVTHPKEFGKAIVGWDVWVEEGVAYWAGTAIPGILTGLFTAGGGLASRLGGKTDELGELSDARRLDGAADARRGASATEDLDEAAQLRRASDQLTEGLDDGFRSGPGEWWERIRRGVTFNEENRLRYPYNEVYLDSPSGSRVRVDSYDPDLGEIVSRKHTQLGEVQEKTALSYIDEMAKKYPPGRRISDVPSSGDLAGEELHGMMILEVPPQRTPIPPGVLRRADELGVQIRDTTGLVYRSNTGVVEGVAR